MARARAGTGSSRAGRKRAPLPAPVRTRPADAPLHVEFVGSEALLGSLAPSADAPGVVFTRLARDGRGRSALSPPVDVTVILDPPRHSAAELASLAGLRLGVLTEREPEPGWEELGACLDRLVSFCPALSGERVGGVEVWRAIAPPVSDSLFGDVRELHNPPRVMSIGRSTEHREHVLMPVKHHHDLLQVVHGVVGEELTELVGEFDVGIYVPRAGAAGFAQQVALHLAAGHLLLATTLDPNHGLERDIDYLHFSSSEGISWTLDRLARFPEMYQRIRIRGRLKAEQFRASRVFARLAQDLLADVRAFGSERRPSAQPARAAADFEERELRAHD